MTVSLSAVVVDACVSECSVCEWQGRGSDWPTGRGGLQCTAEVSEAGEFRELCGVGLVGWHRECWC